MNSLFLVRLGRIEWRGRALRIVRYAAFVRQRLVVIGAIPIAAPFPDVARHVVKTETVWWKRFHWRNTCITVFARIFHRKFSLPGVRHPFPAGSKFITPHVLFSG